MKKLFQDSKYQRVFSHQGLVVRGWLTILVRQFVLLLGIGGVWIVACDQGGSQDIGAEGGNPINVGEVVQGQYHLGPVEWEGSFWNSCAPYPPEIQEIEGTLLAGLGVNYNGDGQLCDACIKVETDMGKSQILRVVTTGATNEPGDIDVSKAAFDLLDSGEYPRAMRWQVVQCPATGDIYYQFQTGAHVDWTSLWVRNATLPLEKVEVRSSKHSDFVALQRGSDGTYTDSVGFGVGTFTLRIVALSGEIIEDTFEGFEGGDLLRSPTGQF